MRKIGLLLVVLLVVVVGFKITNKKDIPYHIEEYVARTGDTFWGIYEEYYPENISYYEAMDNFLMDNNMEKYSLFAGQQYLIRIYEEE